MDRTRRPEDHCPELESPLPVAPPLPQRPLPPCDPPLPELEPSFTAPAAAPLVEPEATRFPPPYRISSLAVNVNCATHYAPNEGQQTLATGDPYTLAAGEVFDFFYFQNVAGLSARELSFIADWVFLERDTVGELLAAADTAQLARLLNLSVTKAAACVAAYAAVVTAAAAQAQVTAVSRLVCRWSNRETTLRCNGELRVAGEVVIAGEGPDALPTPNSPSTVPAAIYFSAVSQAEADSQALEAATAARVCRWGHPEVTVECSDSGRDALDPGDPDLAAGGVLPALLPGNLIFPHPVFPTQRYLTNRVVVPANSITSDESPAAALELARAYGLSALDCFYRNPAVTASCEDLGKLGTRLQPVSYDGSNRGAPVTVAAGYLASAVSWADAEEQAVALARTALDCVWVNRELTYACDDKNADPADPAKVALHLAGAYPTPLTRSNKSGVQAYASALEATLELLASPWPRSPVYDFTVEAAAFESDSSQADADELAAAYAVSQLACVYCNPRIDPVCAKLDKDPESPDFGLLPPEFAADFSPPGPGRDPATMELPIPADMTDGTWSVDATAGVPGVLYVPTGVEPAVIWKPHSDFYTEPAPKVFLCSPDPFEVVTVADIVGVIPFTQMSPQSRNANCLYGNVAHYAACRVSQLPPTYPEGSVLWPLTDAADAAYYSPRSTPGYVVVSADSIRAESSEQANALAAVTVQSLLACFFESPALSLFCGVDTAAALPSASYFTAPTSGWVPPVLELPTDAATFYGFTPVHPASSGAYPGSPVAMPYGYGSSYSSPREAFDQALLIGIGQLDCFWKNVEQTGMPCCGLITPVPMTDPPCAPGDITIRIGRVPAGQYTSRESQAEADALAKALADALTACATRDDFDIPPGPDDPGAPLLDLPESPFDVTLTPGTSCCEMKIVTASEDTKLFSPGAAGYVEADIATLAPPGELGCATAGYIYLKVYTSHYPTNPDFHLWETTSGEILFSELPLEARIGIYPDYTHIHRLIAEVSGSASDCSDVEILQSVSTAQKLEVVYENGRPEPVISDYEGGGGPPPTRLTPFEGRLVKTGAATYELTMAPGNVVCREIKTGEGMTVVEVTGLPSGESVGLGDKYWVTATEDAEGRITEASAVKGADWPPSTVPSLKGGDEATGTTGTRIYRLCEVVTSTDGFGVKLRYHHTGAIDHFVPRRLQNTGESAAAAADKARVLHKFDAAKGLWLLRALISSKDQKEIKVEETTDGDGPAAPSVIQIRGGGTTFHVKVWTTSISGDPSNLGGVIVTQSSVPEFEIFSIRGVLFLGTTASPPPGWEDVASGAEVIDLSYVTPTA